MKINRKEDIMFFPGLLFALVIACLLTLIFAIGFRRQGWGIGLLLFFLILFLATWAGGLWITPIGPLWWGIPWLAFLWVGIIMALLLAALIPDNRRSQATGISKRMTAAEADTLVAIDIFFWVLIAGLLVTIIIRYLIL
jgi:hypothetical protein